MTAPVRKVAAYSPNGTVVLDCGHVTSSRRGHDGGGWSPVFVAEMSCATCETETDEAIKSWNLRRGQGLRCEECGMRRWNGWRQYHEPGCVRAEP